MTAPRATYRLQLRAGFGFSEAAAVAPYLARLGVSHVYLSPFFGHGTDHKCAWDWFLRTAPRWRVGFRAGFALVEPFDIIEGAQPPLRPLHLVVRLAGKIPPEAGERTPRITRARTLGASAVRVLSG